MKSCRTDIKTLYAFQTHVRAYAGNLTYGVRLQMDVGDRLAGTFSSAMRHCCAKKLRILISYRTDTVEIVPLNFEYSIVSIKLNYGDTISFPNKLKFGHINILILE